MSTAFSSGRIQPSLLPAMAEGLDLTRTVPGRALGVWKAATTATILAGQIVARNSDGEIVLCTGAGAIGVSKWNKATAVFGTVTSEAVVLTGVTAHALKHPLVAAVLVTNLAGVAYTVTTDYTANLTNGTVTRVALGGIADGETVLVSYRFAAQTGDLDFQGRNFFNFLDDTAAAQGRLVVLEGPAKVFTAAYDTSLVYAVGDVLKCGADGYVTKTGAGDVVGKVIQPPSATDPYLGYNLTLLG